MAQIRENIAQSELTSDVVNTPMRKRVTDLDHAGGDTGAMQVFASLRDANVVLDGPVGCHVMPAVAVINYTDAIPYLQNVTCSELSETEVTLAGTLGVLKEKVAAASAAGRQVFIVSTPVSELIGATWTTEHAHIKGSALFFDSHSLDDDEWKSRDRALLFLWQNREHFVVPEGQPRLPKARPCVNIIGPTYGNFNSYSDLAEIKRLIAGIGADVNLVYPFEASAHDTQRLADADASVVMYREYGQSLAREVGLPTFFAPIGLEPTTRFLRELGAAIGLAERSRRLHQAGKENDAGGLARHLALDAQRLLRQRADRDRRAADVQGRPRPTIWARSWVCRLRSPRTARAPRALRTRPSARRCANRAPRRCWSSARSTSG